MVLIPGFMLDETLWDDFIANFTGERDFIPVSLTQGNSIDEIATNITKTLPESFILAGFSLGGYVARAIYDANPDRTAAMILIATSLRADSDRQKESRIAAASATSAKEFRGLSTTAIRKSLHTDSAFDAVTIDRIRNMGKRLGAEVFKAQSGLNRERITIKPVTCPVYVIAAKQDQLRSMTEAEELAALTSARLEYIDSCGHLIPVEKPLELAHLLASWLTDKGL